MQISTKGGYVKEGSAATNSEIETLPHPFYIHKPVFCLGNTSTGVCCFLASWLLDIQYWIFGLGIGGWRRCTPAHLELATMPHITTAMRLSRRRGIGDVVVESLLGRRAITDSVNNVKSTFSSWDNCMQETYCK